MKALVNVAFVLIGAVGLEQRAFAAEDPYRATELRDITDKPHVGTVQAEHLNNLSQIIGYSTDAAGTLLPTFWYHFFPTNLLAAYEGQIETVNGLNDRSEIVGTERGQIVLLRRDRVEFRIVGGIPSPALLQW